jgi:hypothetical protein
MPSYLADFCHLADGTECPETYMRWCGLSLIGAVAGPKLWTQHGTQISVDPKLYVTNVGSAGSGKSFAMGKAEEIFVKHFPSYLVSESVQSREDILNKMTSDQCLKLFKTGDGKYMEYRPFYCIVDEMENFLSVDDKKMVGMLVGIYSRTSFGTGFKNDANKNQRIINPYLSLLSCAVPEWMMSSLRMALFTGGLGRRLIVVYCKKAVLVPEPNKPLDYDETMARIVSHLKQVEAAIGFVNWTPAARLFWNTWYMNPNRFDRTDQLLVQFHETKHIQMLKVALNLCLSESPLKLTIDAPHLEFAQFLLDELEGGIKTLTSGIGRNELAAIANQVVEYLERVGVSDEPKMRALFWRNARDNERVEIEQHLIQQGKILKFDLPKGSGKYFYASQSGYDELRRNLEKPEVNEPSQEPTSK